MMKNKAIKILERIKKRQDLIKWYIDIIKHDQTKIVIFKDKFDCDNDGNILDKLKAGIYENSEVNGVICNRILIPSNNKGGWWYDKDTEFFPDYIRVVETPEHLKEWEKLIILAFNELD